MLFVLLMVPFTAYAGTAKYDKAIPAFKGDSTEKVQEKTTNNDYFNHSLEYMAGSLNKVNVWLETPLGTNLSNPSVVHTEGAGLKKISFYSSKNLSVHDKVKLNIQNAVSDVYAVQVRGNYNYQ